MNNNNNNLYCHEDGVEDEPSPPSQPVAGAVSKYRPKSPGPCVMMALMMMRTAIECEGDYQPSASYFVDMQIGVPVEERIDPTQREIVLKFFFELLKRLMMSSATFTLAVNLLDRFLSLVPLRLRHLPVTAAACVLIAGKIRESSPPTVEELTSETRRFSAADLLTMEEIVLSKLRWRVNPTTSQDFLALLFCQLSFKDSEQGVVRASDRLRQVAVFFVDIAASAAQMLLYPPSMHAVSALEIASDRCGFDGAEVGRFITNHCLVDMNLDHLRACVNTHRQVIFRETNDVDVANRMSVTPSPASVLDAEARDAILYEEPGFTPINSLAMAPHLAYLSDSRRNSPAPTPTPQDICDTYLMYDPEPTRAATLPLHQQFVGAGDDDDLDDDRDGTEMPEDGEIGHLI